MRETMTRYRHGISRGFLTIALLGVLSLGLGGVPGARAQEYDYAIGASVAVASETLTYRAEPGVDAAALLVLSQGARGTITDGPVLADGYTWYELSTADYTDLSGWVAGEFLTAAGDAPAPGGSVVTVTFDEVNLRAVPSIAGPVVAVLPAGLALTLIGGPTDADGYSWYEVESLDQSLRGWVAGDFLTVSAATEALLP